MGELAKAIRWTTPGAVALTITLVVVVWTRAWTRLLLESTGDGPLLDVGASSLLTGAALSIPIGFLVYQAYFYGFSRPFLLWRAVRADLGNLVLDIGPVEIEGRRWVALPSEEPLLRVRRKVRSQVLRRSAAAVWLYEMDPHGSVSPMPSDRSLEGKYYDLLETHHARLEAVIARCTFIGSDTMRAESARLADIYHTLGACRWALVLGWTGGLGWSVWTSLYPSSDPVTALAAATLTVLAWLWLSPFIAYAFVVMHVNRRHSFGRRVILLRHMVEADEDSRRSQRIPGWRGSRS